MKKALIVEDLRDAQQWLRQVLQLAFPGVEVRLADSLEEARALLLFWEPEIALVDLNLPDGSGIDLIRELSAQLPACISVVATIYDDDQHIFPALRAGAQGYLLKEESQQRLGQLLQGIVSGVPPLSPRIARRLVNFFAEERQASDESPLTQREREVLALIAKGYTLTTVSELLQISRHTTASHVKSIYSKLKVSSRAEATVAAARLGVINPHG